MPPPRVQWRNTKDIDSYRMYQLELPKVPPSSNEKEIHFKSRLFLTCGFCFLACDHAGSFCHSGTLTAVWRAAASQNLVRVGATSRWPNQYYAFDQATGEENHFWSGGALAAEDILCSITAAFTAATVSTFATHRFQHPHQRLQLALLRSRRELTPIPTPCTGRCAPTPRPRPTPHPRPTPL